MDPPDSTLKRDLKKKFLKNVKKTKGCWYWTGGKRKKGYGDFYIGHGKRDYAHRVAFILWNGLIPSGFTVDHECHNQDKSCPGGISCPHRLCVRPSHLKARTHRDNILRGRSTSAKNAVKTACPKGHKYTPSNTRIQKANNGRQCIRCDVDRKREKRESLYAQGLTALGTPRKVRART